MWTTDNKLLELKLHRFLRANHNRIREIPYDLSLMVQRYEGEISLGKEPKTMQRWASRAGNTGRGGASRTGNARVGGHPRVVILAQVDIQDW